jgi:hypothetical protein
MIAIVMTSGNVCKVINHNDIHKLKGVLYGQIPEHKTIVCDTTRYPRMTAYMDVVHKGKVVEGGLGLYNHSIIPKPDSVYNAVPSKDASRVKLRENFFTLLEMRNFNVQPYQPPVFVASGDCNFCFAKIDAEIAKSISLGSFQTRSFPTSPISGKIMEIEAEDYLRIKVEDTWVAFPGYASALVNKGMLVRAGTMLASPIPVINTDEELSIQLKRSTGADLPLIHLRNDWLDKETVQLLDGKTGIPIRLLSNLHNTSVYAISSQLVQFVHSDDLINPNVDTLTERNLNRDIRKEKLWFKKR